MAKKKSPDVLKLSAKFLNRLSSSPKFARKFDKDPAAALQELFPQLAKVPKKKITSILNAHMKLMSAAFAMPQIKQYKDIRGYVSAALKVAKKLVKTSKVRAAAKYAVKAAKYVATAVAAEVASRLLSTREEPEPE